MFICVKLPVLCNTPLCALPNKKNKQKRKILQVNKLLQKTESSIWRSHHSQTIFYFTYLQSTLHKSLHVHSRWKFRRFFCFFFTYYVCIGHIHIFIHSYILWCFMEHGITENNLKWVVLWLNEWLFVHHTVCCGDGANLSLFVLSGKKSLQVDQSAHSCSAGVTQEQKCLASSGGKKHAFVV